MRGHDRARFTVGVASARAADGDAVDAQRRLADADRHALAVLAAGADAAVECKVVADHRHAVQVGRSVADQHRALDRRPDLAVLDAIRLGTLEHVFARGDVDLAAAEMHGVDAVLDRGEDFAGIAIAGQHVGVGHARHRHVGETFAAAVAGRFHAHQARVLPSLHEADKDAVFDQHGAAGRRALVVDRQRAAACRHGAVVNDGNALRGDLLAHQARKGRGLLAVEVAFEAMTDGLVQHDAGPAGPEHHIHFARGRRHRLQIDQRLADGVVDRTLPSLSGDETLIALAAAITVAAGLLTVAFADHNGDADAHQRPHVAIDLAVGAHDLDRLPGCGEAGGNLAHARILGARIGVDRLEQTRLGLECRAAERAVLAVKFRVGARGRRRVAARIAALDGAYRIGGALDRRLQDVGRVGVADGLVLDGAQAEALRGVVGRLLEPAV